MLLCLLAVVEDMNRLALSYSCRNHVGYMRRMNQDNILCNQCYMEEGNTTPLSLDGEVSCKEFSLFGVFDGMGGEERGEAASYIAAKAAASVRPDPDPANALKNYCTNANLEICKFARENTISSMGTTAALLAIKDNNAVWCNVGDSKVFRHSCGNLVQLSYDHLGSAPLGRKAPLSQYLGIEPDEMVIEPQVGSGRLEDGDVFLLCSDGLTDMLSLKDLCTIISEVPFEALAENLLQAALDNGGRDNISIIVCRVWARENQLIRRAIHRLKMFFPI